MTPLHLSGGPRARGRAQAEAAPRAAGAVREAVEMRLGRARAEGRLGRRADAFLEEAHAVCARVVPAALAEIEGIAEGFRLTPDAVFAYLHLGVLADLAAGPAAHADGCSVWAVASGADGPLVVKNRDFRGEHVGLQRVFAHRDPDWAGNAVLCIGSLGSPGAYSSGVNAHGLALVDTQVATADHAPGVLRYFVMSEILGRCADVAAALDLLVTIPHAGGGTLVMADRSGALAAVELGASRIAVERSAGWVARTNHFVSDDLASATLRDAGDPMGESSVQRLAALRARVPGADRTPQTALDLMGAHGGAGALCRHGEDGDARTISGAVFACAPGTLYLADGFACTGDRHRFAVAA